MGGDRVLASALTGAALDWAVAQAIGLELEVHPPIYGTGPRLFVPDASHPVRWWPSTDWAQGGQLLDRFTAQVRSYPYEVAEGRGSARVFHNGCVTWQSGDTPLIALCRAVVAAQLGQELQVPAEVTNG